MIKPVNGHLLITPIKHEDFMASSHETYQEVGLVVATSSLQLAPDVNEMPNIGDKVYFDSWLAAKYPQEGGGQDDFYWLVKWADVRAIEHVDATA